MLNILCLKAGYVYGANYVNALHNACLRNITVPFKFHCITDDFMGCDSRINHIPLPGDLETWWGKIWMFKRNLFPDGSRMMFMDLDTLIIDNIDDVAEYDDQIASLRDFYYPKRVGPAIILWEAGDYAASIWEEWVRCGKPRDKMGDLWWINNLDQGHFAKNIDRLQDRYPGIVSYKADKCDKAPPPGARIVCFHGQPKPHNCGAPWVADAWR